MSITTNWKLSSRPLFRILLMAAITVLPAMAPRGASGEGVKRSVGSHAGGPGKSCDLTLEGEVKDGVSYTHPGPAGLDFMLEAIPSGWIARLLQHGVPRTAFDAAGLATPPYQSPNPILISTDFSFRAQDALGWNPRNFQYFGSKVEMQKAVAAYQTWQKRNDRAAMGELLGLSAAAKPAQLEILDAHLIAGTNDQTIAANRVASHFIETPHVVDAGPATKLGRITAVRFRVTFPGARCTSVRVPNR